MKKTISILTTLFFATAALAQVDSTMDLYFLIGQSNMAGRGEVTGEYKEEGSPAVLMLDKENHWVQAKHPLHFDKPSVAGVGPGLSFGMEMAGSTGHKVGLIPCAVGGTSIDTWLPGGYDKATNTHPYDDAMLRLAIAMRSGTVKGVIWLQGEADSNPEKSKRWLAKLATLIGRIRTVTNIPALPFVAGELGNFKEQYANINKELALLPGMVPSTAVASSEGLADKGDQTHFDSKSADTYGKRFAEKMKTLKGIR